MNTKDISPSLATLAAELAAGAPKTMAFVLNTGDAGLLRSLDKLSADAASHSVTGGATIAAHVDHVRYGLSLMNRWSKGEDPWGDADWSQSWRISGVTDAEWKKLRADVGREAKQWCEALRQPRDVEEAELNGMIGSIVHLAYHLGAIRQIDQGARGPKEPGPARPS